MTLTEFLLARVEEDERVAREARPEEHLNTRDRRDLLAIKREGYATCSVTSGRVLAECETKRRIVELFTEEQTRADIYNRGYNDGHLNDNDLGDRARSNSRARGLEEAVLALAAVYADHPDYREGWRPEAGQDGT